MKLNVVVRTVMKTQEAGKKVEDATERALVNVIAAIASDVINIHPWKTQTGNNSRSIKFEAKGLEGKVYSTSGYGGFLETGTARMPPFPYFRPALDRNVHKLPEGIKAELK